MAGFSGFRLVWMMDLITFSCALGIPDRKLVASTIAARSTIVNTLVASYLLSNNSIFNLSSGLVGEPGSVALILLGLLVWLPVKLPQYSPFLSIPQHR
jgi:hypothetical protein